MVRRGRPFVMVMLCLSLLGSQSSVVAASEGGQVDRTVLRQTSSEVGTVSSVSAQFDQQHVGYVDPETGTIYYNISGIQDDKRWYSVVERSPDGTLMRWEDGFTSIYDAGDAAPRVSILPSKYSPGDLNQGYYYDVASSTVREGNAYAVSPDHRWAFTIDERYVAEQDENGANRIQKEYSYWVKDADTKVLEEVFTSPSYARAAWTADNQMILQRYSTKAKQNEIVLFDPSTHKWQFVMNASLLIYLRDRHLLVYTNNEPTRQPKAYDMSTKRAEVLTTEALNKLYEESRQSYSEIEKLDPELNITRLPVKSLAFTRNREHKVELDGQTIKIPYAVKKKGTLWLPVKSLADALHWKIEPLKTEAADYQYGIQQGAYRIELVNENSIVIKDRLFITRGQLQSLGYKDIQVSPNKMGK